jgi:hypothetical protein
MNYRMPKSLFLALACACFAVGPLHAAPASQAGTELQLAFWNIRDLSTNSRDACWMRTPSAALNAPAATDMLPQ